VLDKRGENLITFDEFTAGLSQIGIVLTDHEIHILVRVFDHNKDGKISIEEFYNTLASY
jgi:Ca2+-binding EF-hand superfamily protein